MYGFLNDWQVSIFSSIVEIDSYTMFQLFFLGFLLSWVYLFCTTIFDLK